MRGIGIIAYCVFGLLEALAAQTHAQDKPYVIKNGEVDEYTLQGRRTYQEVNCGLCHGDSGQGASGPNLSRRLKHISKEDFIDSVTRGKGLMPPYISDPRVIDNMDQIYSYLKARSDGALGESKTKKRVMSVEADTATPDALQSYAAQCDAAIPDATVRTFNCDMGAEVPINHEIPPPPLGKFPDTTCDEPNRLNQQCDGGSRFTVLANTPNAYAVAHCRKKGYGLHEYGDIAVIQHNRVTGATCFYQSQVRYPEDGDPPFRGDMVKAPSEGLAAWPWWSTPQQTAAILCVHCHDNGPIIRSPYLAQLDSGANALPGARDTTFNSNPQKYFFVGHDFAAWKVYKVEVKDNLCTTCHRLGVSNVSSGLRGTAIDFALRATQPQPEVHKNPYSPDSPIWMPPHHTFFDQKDRDFAQQIHDCAMRISENPLPNSPDCRLIEYTASNQVPSPPKDLTPIYGLLFDRSRHLKDLAPIYDLLLERSH